MNILHYNLGFPPFRTGGLINYAISLINEEIKYGHNACMIWPGRIGTFKHKTFIFKKIINGIKSFEIINPLPIPYDEGINEIDNFIKNGDENVYVDFFEENKFDIIHIHTLMGLHKSFITAAKKKNIKIIFTTHDYFGICPRVKLYNPNVGCLDGNVSFNNCTKCNTCALSYNKIILLQSNMYKILKDSKIIKSLRQKHRKKTFDNNFYNKNSGNMVTTDDYLTLQNYYMSILNYCDIIHCNSKVSYNIYSKYINKDKLIILPITHNKILNNKKIRSYDDAKIRISYLGPLSEEKGYFYLKDCIELSENKNIVLNIYNEPKLKASYENVFPKYNIDDLKVVFDNADVLVVPSLWMETFGFTLLEALSYGVPVITSDNVGASILLNENYGYTYNSYHKQELINILDELNSIDLSNKNKNIFKNFNVPLFTDHCKEILEIYNDMNENLN